MVQQSRRGVYPPRGEPEVIPPGADWPPTPRSGVSNSAGQVTLVRIARLGPVGIVVGLLVLGMLAALTVVLLLGLAVVGLYGVIAATVSQSTRELALRIALGADAADLLHLVLARSLVLTAGGILVGLAVALQVTRLLGYLLYNVSPRDPLAFGLAFVIIALASLVACLVPAWRATRTDPVLAMRG